MNKRLKNAVGQVSGTILMLVVALAVGAVFVAISGNSPAISSRNWGTGNMAV